MAEALKLTYIAAQLRVKVELTRSACLASELPPADIISRAKAKMEAIKSAGEVAFFFVYESRFHEVWRALRALPSDGDERKIWITLAAGAPQLSGLTVEVSTQEKAIVAVSVDAPRESLQNWRYEWFKLVVVKRTRELGVKAPLNNAQLFALFLRAKAGEKIASVPLGAATMLAAAPGQKAKPYSVIASKQRGEVAVVVRELGELRQGPQRDTMLALVAQAVRQLSEPGVEFKLVKKELLGELQNAMDGPESLAIDLPLILLAAVGLSTAEAVRPEPASHQGMGKIGFEVSKDKLEASISGFKMDYYDDPSFTVSVDWIALELKRHHITMPMSEAIKRTLLEAIRVKQSLGGMLAAQGEAGTANRGAHLHPSFLDAAEQQLLEGAFDLRELQQRRSVRKGQLIAEVRYHEKAKLGRDIYGQELPSPPDEDFLVVCGEEVERREGGRFYAACDGVPTVEGTSIALAKMMVHEGDVNLRSGNIRFDGPVEIKGSIDFGATVETSGDLLVHGSIRGAWVRVGGNLIVRGGITTGERGKVRVRGKLLADFIENANILCGGELRVNKVLLNSQVIVGASLQIGADDGVLAGGRVHARETIRCGVLGYRRGQMTYVNVGVDWKAASAVEIRTGRLEKLIKRQADDRAALRELVQRKKEQMTARHREILEKLQERLQTLRVLIDRAEAHLADAKAQVSYNNEARLYVRQGLCLNVAIEAAGQVVTVTHEVAGVVIMAKRRRGSFIHAIEEIEAEDQAAGAGLDQAS